MSPLHSNKLLTTSTFAPAPLLLMLAALDVSVSCDRSCVLSSMLLLCTCELFAVVTVTFPFLIGLNKCVSDFGDKDIFVKGGLAHLGGGGGGVVFTLLVCVGE